MNDEFVRYPTERWIRDGRRSPLNDRIVPVSTYYDESADELDGGDNSNSPGEVQNINTLAAEKMSRRCVRFATNPVIINDKPRRRLNREHELIANEAGIRNARLNVLNIMAGDTAAVRNNKDVIKGHKLAAEKKIRSCIRVAATHETIDVKPTRSQKQEVDVIAKESKSRLDEMKTVNGDLNNKGITAAHERSIVIAGGVKPVKKRTVAAGELLAADKDFLASLDDDGVKKVKNKDKKENRDKKAKKIQSAKVGPTPGEVSEQLNSQFSELQMRAIIRSFCVERYRLNDFERYIQPSHEEEKNPKTTIKQSLKKKLELLAFNIPGKTDATKLDERKYTVAPRHMGEDGIKSEVKSVTELDAILSNSVITCSNEKIPDENDKGAETGAQKGKHKKTKDKKKKSVQSEKDAPDSNGSTKATDKKKSIKGVFKKVKYSKVGPTPGEKLEPLIQLTEDELRSKVMEFCVEGSGHNDNVSSANREETPKKAKLKNLQKTIGRFIPGKKGKAKAKERTHAPAATSQEENNITSIVEHPVLESTDNGEIEARERKAYKHTTVARIWICPNPEATAATREADAIAIPASDHTPADTDSDANDSVHVINKAYINAESLHAYSHNSGQTTFIRDSWNESSPNEVIEENQLSDIIKNITKSNRNSDVATVKTQSAKKKKRTIFRRVVDRLFRRKKGN